MAVHTMLSWLALSGLANITALHALYQSFLSLSLSRSLKLLPALDFPSEAQRIQCVKQLVDAGYADRVLLAHDMHTKHRLVRYIGQETGGTEYWQQNHSIF